MVVRFQGPQANGIPELHKLTPYLGTLQDRGFKVALVTDMPNVCDKVYLLQYLFRYKSKPVYSVK